jgi:histidinol-phosphate aminotransferase
VLEGDRLISANALLNRSVWSFIFHDCKQRLEGNPKNSNVKWKLFMSRYWSPIVKGLVPYVPGEQPKLTNLIKLNTNENPYGPSPKVLEALHEETADSLRLYPDPNADPLKQAVADCYHLKPANVFVGNGSDEVLAHVFIALLKHDDPILFPDITYSFYPVYCRLYEIEYETVPLTDAFEINIESYFKKNGGILIANPNAPTGRVVSLASIEKLVQQNIDSVVVVDEAYVDFGGESAAPLIHRYPNLLVIHTLSKSRSLAGLRVGYAMGDPLLIEALERVKNSFNSYPLDRLAIAGATAAVMDRAYFDNTRHKVMETRERLVSALVGFGFEVIPSKANFIFTRHPKMDAWVLAKALRDRSIIVRHFNLPRIDQYLRITVGTDAQLEALTHALKEIVGI